MFKEILIFLAGVIVIFKSADLFTDGAEGIGRAFRIPRVIIGVTIVSLATTFPEFTVSTISSYIGSAGIAVGNALGSCLANIGLILGLVAIISPVRFNTKILKREIPFLMLVCVAFYILILDNTLDSAEGLVLALVLILFFVYIVLGEFKARKGTEEKRRVSVYNPKKDVLRFLIGAIGVIVSSKYTIVPSGINIARILGVPEVVIGLTMVAVGTSLPELFTAIVASIKRMSELAAGNIIGANILNMLWVLGVSSAIRPLEIDHVTKIVTMPAVLAFTLVLFLLARTKLRLVRKEGLVLLIIYACYIFYIFRFAYT